MKLFKPKLSTILYPLSSILCPLSVILSLFAAGAARGETVECASWADVKTALSSGKNAKLKNDITADSRCDVSSYAVTLDTNGKTLSFSVADSLFCLTESASLTIVGGGKMDGKKQIVIYVI